MSVGTPPSRRTTEIILRAVAYVLLLVGLYIAQLYSYLFFHSLVEIFTVAVAAALLMLTWNARFFVERHFLLWIAIGYGFVALIDLLHTLVYRGMGVFGDLGVDPPTQLWVAARFMQALILLTSPLFLRRKFNVRLAFAGYAVLVTLIVLSIFAWDIFPVAFDDSIQRLTPFKIIAEYVICAMLLIAAALILARRRQFDRTVLWLLVGSIISTLLAELSFTLYTDPYGLTNLMGHYLKLVAFYLLYRATVAENLRRPHQVLFRDLTRREEELRQSQEQLAAMNQTLEERVLERTAQVRTLAGELSQAEHRERERLAAILHDDLQQVLAAARMRVQMAATAPDGPAEALERADEYLAEAIDQCRCLAVEMSPKVVSERGLGGALVWLGEHMHERHGLNVEVTVSGDIDHHDPDVETSIFRAVRELLFNVTKHANVDHARLCATRRDDGSLCITVRDSGQGFDPEAVEACDSGFGLGSVRSHTEILGGSCVVSSQPGEGTRATLLLPGE